MVNRSELAAKMFSEGFNCAQSVLFSFIDMLDIDKETALKITCGFGSGMGRMQEVCGAVSGGIAAIGLKYGKGQNDDSNTTEITYNKVRELMSSFEAEKGSYICKKLLNECDLKTDKGQKAFKENAMKQNICIPCVQATVRILEKLM